MKINSSLDHKIIPRLVKLGVISIVFFCLLLTAISLLLPSSITISRAIDINAPVSLVYGNINNLANWKKWYANYDSSSTSSSTDISGKGASFRSGKTTIKIDSITPVQIKTLWKTGNGDAMPSQFNFIRQGESSVFTLQWQFIQKVKWYPWEKFASIVSDKTIGPFMEKSLENLKQLAENSAVDGNQ